MNATEAPNQIILSADTETGELYDEWFVRDLTDNIKIEYIRKDAFIEKTCKWFEKNWSCYTYPSSLMFDDFKKYMKGE